MGITRPALHKLSGQYLRSSASIAMIGLAGCQHSPQWLDTLVAGEPRISDAVWLRTAAVQNIDYNGADFLPVSCGRLEKNGTDQKTDVYLKPDADVQVYNYADVRASKYRLVYATEPGSVATCVSDMKVLIDRRFEHWIDSFNSASNFGTASIDTAVIGAGLAGGLAGGLTSQVMNLVSSGLTGVKKTAEQDILLTNTVQNIITQMKTDRAKWDAVIEGRLQATQKFPSKCSPQEIKQPTSELKQSTSKSSSKSLKFDKPVSSSSEEVAEDEQDKFIRTTTITVVAKPIDPTLPYCTLADAWSDLENYSYQGSFGSAMSALNANVGAQSSACQAQKLNIRKASSTGSAAGGSSASGDATATSPCPPTTGDNTSKKAGDSTTKTGQTN